MTSPATRPGLHPRERGDGRPLWAQVKAAMLDDIQGGGLAEHAQLPSEADLCTRFGVSRTVVREALNQLVHERVIYKLQGKGAFVAGRGEDQDFVGSTVGFSGELADQRRNVTRQVLRQTVVPSDSQAERLLRLPPGTPMVAVDRVLSVDGVPRLHVTWAMPEALVPGLDQIPLHNRSLYDTLARQYGIVFRRADRWLSAVNADRVAAATLGVVAGTPLIRIESVAEIADGTPVEIYRALYRSDSARLHVAVGGTR